MTRYATATGYDRHDGANIYILCTHCDKERGMKIGVTENCGMTEYRCPKCNMNWFIGNSPERIRQLLAERGVNRKFDKELGKFGWKTYRR